MQIKRLEIQGFKTFVEPVSFNFEYPIMAIVGPNGSGKSNIVDAVKWCMGEQSTRQLRANQMSDLIFNGSEHRKSVGMAEVSLIFSNNGAGVPAAYASFSEMAVTRRMYRGEESEYYLNNDSRRLKDVLEFLMDIGISSKAFSIIEQGQIGEIIDAKPEMRRYVIEDAAGILKYKNRKKIALDKIELTRGNIARISDLLSEIKRQLNQVNKQVKVAQEYKSLKDEYRKLELNILKTEYLRFMSLFGEKKALLEQARFELAKLTSRVSARYADHQRVKDRLDKQAADMAERQRRMSDLSAEAMVMKEKIESAGKLKETLLRDNERIQGSTDELNEAAISLKEQIGSGEQKLEDQKKELGFLAETMQLYEREKNELVDQINAAKDKIEEERNNEFSRVKMITEIDNQIIAAEHDLENTARRQERIQHDLEAINQKTGALKDEQESLQSQEAETALRLKNSEERSVSVSGQLKSIGGELEQVASLMEQAQKVYEGLRSRYATLEELRKNLDGYSEGTRFVLQQSAQFNIGKVLADYIQVKPGYELAVQAVLGDVIQAMVVSGYDTAEELIEVLRKQEKGRAVFLVRSGLQHVQAETREGAESLLGAVDVRDEEMLPVFRSLLENVYVVSSLKEAADVAGNGATAVTRAGDVVRSGIVHGGSEGAIKGGLLDRRSEMEKLKLEIDAALVNLKQYETKKTDLSERSGVLTSELSDIGAGRQEMERQLFNIRTKLQGLEEQLNSHESSLLALNMEEEEIKRNLSELYEEAGDLRQKKAIFEEDKGTNAGIIEALRNSLADLESQLDGKKESIAESNAGMAAFRERLNAKAADIKRMQGEYEDINRKLVSLKQEAENNNGRLETSDREILSAGGKLAAVNEDISVLQGSITDAKASYDKEFREHTEMEQEMKQLEKEISALKDSESAHAVEVSELGMKANYSSTTAKDKYGTDLEHYDAEPLGDDELQKSRDRLVSLSEKIAKMGDVNVGAIAEHEELQKRVDFYEKHKQDLEDAIENLKKVISSINRESRKLFRETFDKINENFKRVIPKLFEGGKGELILTDEQDLLESGMEIVIQPPGKRLQNISLLSGGEKALSAVALLMSVFMVRPSPFALLDEIDAPLDDASVAKLNGLIKELSTNSQFILITHNKKTVEIADVIYGITMAEPGVSKILSVKLQKEAV